MDVAAVFGADGGLGRSLALALAARGVAVVVAGDNERALGLMVGEIAAGGGRARHVAINTYDPAQMEAVVDKAREAFGGLTFVVAIGLEAIEMTQVLDADFSTVTGTDGGRAAPFAMGSGANELVLGGSDPERAIDLALLLCLDGRMKGQRVLLGCVDARPA